MSEPTTIQGARGTLPNPKGFGFSWRPLQKLLAEQQRVHNDSLEVDGEYRQLEAQISVMERAEFEALADSFRDGGTTPDGANIAEARAELDGVKKKAAALSRALEKVDAELVAVVGKHAPEWGREVNAKALERAEAVEDAVHRLRKEQAALYAVAALAEWLENPRKNFGHSDGPHLLNTFTHQDVRVGEVFDAVLQDAREKAATPDELERKRWADMGAVTPSRGWTA